MRASFDSKSTETEYVTKLQKSYSLVQEEHLMGDDKKNDDIWLEIVSYFEIYFFFIFSSFFYLMKLHLIVMRLV